MKVPLLDLSYHGDMRERISKAINDVLDTQQFILGPQVQKFEQRIAEYSGARFGIGVSSGTDALLVGLMALGIEAGDEVITTPYSFFATAGAVARLGAKPIFVDIDRATFNLNPALIEKAITKKTKVILPVHLYGQCADMDPILSIAQKYSLPVIEDAAQAIGAEYKNGKRAGSLGVIGCFSFFPSKNLGGIGDGGMVVANDAQIAERVQILRTHGAKPKYYHKFVGGNFRLDTIQAAVLDVRLDSLDGWTKQRQQNATYYREAFAATAVLKNEKVQLPQAVYGSVKHGHIYNQFVVRVEQRDQLKNFLQQNQVGTEVYYPVPLHLQECFRSLGYKKGDFPESEAASEQTLALPIYPELTQEMQAYVVEKIAEFYSKQ